MAVSMNVGPHLQRRGRRPRDRDRWDDSDNLSGGSGGGGDFSRRCVTRGRCCTSSSCSSDNRFLSRISSPSATAPPGVEFVLRPGKKTDEDLVQSLSVVRRIEGMSAYRAQKQEN